MMKSACRSPLGIEKQFSLLNHCQQCCNLQELNSKLQEELSNTRQYAQQCEDEAVDLRRQLCAALKDLSKLKKSIETSNRKCSDGQMPDRGILSSDLIKINDPSKILQTDQEMRMDTDSTKLTSSTENAPLNMCKGILIMEDSSDSKRKVLLAEDLDEHDSSKRQRKVIDAECLDVQSIDISLEESCEVIQDLTAVWTQRIDAIKRIESLLSCNTSCDLACDSSDRLFHGLSIQVASIGRFIPIEFVLYSVR